MVRLGRNDIRTIERGRIIQQSLDDQIHQYSGHSGKLAVWWFSGQYLCQGECQRPRTAGLFALCCVIFPCNTSGVPRKMSCSPRKFLAAGHSSFQIHPRFRCSMHQARPQALFSLAREKIGPQEAFYKDQPATQRTREVVCGGSLWRGRF